MIKSFLCHCQLQSVFFTNDNSEKERYPDALVTGKVFKKAVHIWECSCKSQLYLLRSSVADEQICCGESLVILFKNPNMLSSPL